MESEDMKELLLEEFEIDPIYRMVLLNGLEDLLFTEGILSMHEKATYSTVDAGKIIDRADSTIRNHFRSDLIGYIKPEKFGKFYRLNYKSVFRLHMIFLLMERAGKNTVDLLAELGMHPAVTIEGNFKKNGRSDNRELQDLNEKNSINDRFESIERSMNLQSVMYNILRNEKELSDVERKIENNKSEIELQKNKSYLKYLEEKQSQLLITSLKKTIQKPSFLGLFKKKDEVDLSEITKEVENNLKQKMEQEIEKNISVHHIEIKRLEEEKEKIKSLLDEEKRKAKSLVELEKRYLKQFQEKEKRSLLNNDVVNILNSND